MSNPNAKKAVPDKQSHLSRHPMMLWLQKYDLIPALLLAFGFSLLCLTQFNSNIKWLVVVLCLLSALICVFAMRKGRLQERFSSPVLAMAGYLVLTALSVCWACAGKFFLREFSKLLFCLPLYLGILFCMRKEQSAIRRLLTVLSAAAAFYAFYSVDMATLRLSAPLLEHIPGLATLNVGFESGTRLIGIFGNANISGSVLAVSMFFSLWLLETGDRPSQRIAAAVFFSMQAYNFLLNFSMGATGFFVICVLVYLICSGSERINSLLCMLEIAVPTLIFVFLSFSAFEDEASALPLLCMLLNVLTSVVLELFVHKSVVRILQRHRTLTTAFPIVVAVCILVYGIAGLLLEGSLILESGIHVRRACYPDPGTYTLSASGDGSLNVRVISQNEQEIVIQTETVLYSGSADAAVFTVPEDSKVVFLSFSSGDSAVLQHAEIRDSSGACIALHLGYPLLPDFIANRLQGLRANENAIQRTAFLRDGLKIFREHPLFGVGPGGFESQLYGHQDFRYETRYVHNHYVQVLLDNGLFGFLFYAALLILSLCSLFRGRKKEHPFHSLFPALLSSLLMLILHTLMEVSMSVLVFLPYAFTVFALIALCYGKPPEKKLPSVICRFALLLVSLGYALLISLNISAAKQVNAASGSYRQFFLTLSKAIKTDAFEYTDWKVSYVNNCALLGLDEYKPQADRYAEALLDVPSNSLHQYLLDYYLTFRDYDLALTAASNGVAFNYADDNIWNSYFSSFRTALTNTPEDADSIYRDILQLYDQMLQIQSRLLDETELNQTSLSLIQEAQAYLE